MKRIISLILALMLTVGMLAVSVYAAEPSFQFALSVDGGESKQVHTGDIITVVLRLKRTDGNEAYTMYAMQDEIRYDSNFFELVEGSAVLGKDIASTDIGMRDNYREFYMNYLSTSGGTTWEADTLVGSFQLKVIATSGVTKITNQDYLVSTKDGSGSFDATANELTVMLTTECTVHFESNGGSTVEDQMVQYGEKVTKPADPTREGYTFDAWYKDIDKTEKWDFENDTVTGNMTLFAGWNEVAEVPTETPAGSGFCWWILIVIAALVLLLLLILALLPRNTVTFDSNGGSEVKPKRVLKNHTLKEPGSPRKYRQVFAGWYANPECTVLWNFETDCVTEDVTLYAKWN